MRALQDGPWFWLGLLALTAAAAALIIAVGQPGLALMAVLAAVAAWTVLRTREGHDRWAVWLWRATFTLFAVAHVLLAAVGAGAPAPDAPLVAEVIGNSGFLAMIAWLLRLVSLRSEGGALGTWLDALLVAAALAALAADALLRPPAWLASEPAGLTAAATTVVIVVVATSIGVRLLLTDARRLPSAWLVVTGLGFAVIAHVASALGTPLGTLDAQLANLASYALAGAGIVHASREDLLTTSTWQRESVGSLGRLGFALAALLVLPLLFLRQPDIGPEAVTPVAVATISALVVLWRLGLALRDRQRAAEDLRQHARRQSALAEISRAGVEAREETLFLHRLAATTGQALAEPVTLCSPREAGARHDPDDATEAAAHATISRPIDDQVALRVSHQATPRLDTDRQQFLDAAVDIARAVLQRMDAERQLHQVALHDPLTGLANRVLIWERAQHALSSTRGQRATAGLVLLAVDGLAGLDEPDAADAPRHQAALRELAQQLPRELDQQDTLGRLRGDVLAVVIPAVDLATMEGRTHRAARAVHRVLAPHARDPSAPEATFTVTATSVLAHPQDTAEAMLERADALLSEALARGGGTVATVAGD